MWSNPVWRIACCFQLVLVVLASGFMSTRCEAEAVLVDRGQARATIVVERDPKPETRRAADELAGYLQQMSGANIAVVDAGSNVTTPVTIFIGRDHANLADRFPGLDLSLTDYEQILLAVNGNNVLIAGRDGKDGGARRQAGTAAAIYTFLEERLGVRWFWPGELGTEVPSRSTIALPDFEYRYSPPLKQRHLRLQNYRKNIQGYGGKNEDAYAVGESLNDELLNWRRRQRAEERFIVANHAFTQWWEKYHETHPEYFALQPDGTRSLCTPPDRVKLCISNPGVIEQWVANAREQLESDPELIIVSASPNDNSLEGFCVCENCEAWDAKSGPMVTLRWGDGKRERHVALTDRYARWWNILARRLKEEFPDREVYLGTWAYQSYRTPPVEVQLEDNIIVGHITSMPAYSVERREAERQDWLGWAGQVENLVWRPNLFYYDRGMPLAFMQRSADDFKWLVEHGMVGLDMDTTYGHWALQGLQYYMMGKLAWDPYLDMDQELDDYMQHAFGPDAAPPMLEYFKTLEQIFYEKAELDAKADGGSARIAHLPNIYTPAVIDRLQAQLDAAKARVRQGDSAEKYRQRIAFFQTGLDFTKLQLEAITAASAWREADQNKQELWRRAVEAGERRDAFLDAQLPNYALNTVEGFNNWTSTEELRSMFGPPDAPGGN